MDVSSPPTLLQLPLFPLNSVLFPGGLLPLQIFEVRYLDMIGRRHKAGEPFGVVCLSEGSEVRQRAAGPSGDGFANEAFHSVGTLARIDTLQRPQPGLMLVRCTGTQRFRILRSAQQKFGLWVADVELLADDAAAKVPDDVGFTRSALQGLLRQIEHSIAQSDKVGGEAAELPLRQPYRWDDCGWLANRWCEMLPLAPALKQRFMALDSPVLRLELVADALGQMGFALPE
ncbi:MAG: LON peptidase substrate-binding domain-containing protein [Burkholderiales bacterium]